MNLINTCRESVLSFRHIRAMSVVAILTMLLGLTGTPTASAQLAPPPVDWLHGRDAFELASTWVKAGEVPPIEEVNSITAGKLLGVRVTLRWVGMPLASGDALVSEADVTNLAALTYVATQIALKETQAQLDARATRGGNAITMQTLAPQLTISLQIAHSVQRLRLPDDAPPSDVFNRFAPGHHGLRAYLPNAAVENMAWMWPATALSYNISPAQQVTDLLVNLGYKPDAVELLGRSNGPILERFDVLHISRSSPDAPATLLARGKPEGGTGSLSTGAVTELADRMALHLARRVDTSGRMTGVYHPSEDQYMPQWADDSEAALATIAMARWLNVSRAGNEDPARLTDVQQYVERAIERLIVRLAPPLMRAHHDDWPAAALALIALCDASVVQDRATWRSTLTMHLRSLRNTDGTFRAVPDARSEALPLASQAVIHAALAASYARLPDQELGEELLVSHRKLWTMMDAATGVSALPWLLDAETRLRPTPMGAALRGDPTQGPRIRNIRELIEGMDIRQIRQPPRSGPNDVIGGYTLRQQTPGSPPHVDWTSGYIIAAGANVLRHPDITPPDAETDRLLAVGLGARFIAQLAFDEADCYYVRSQRDAIGGVRLGLWDNRINPAATAINLLAMTELLESVRYLTSR